MINNICETEGIGRYERHTNKTSRLVHGRLMEGLSFLYKLKNPLITVQTHIQHVHSLIMKDIHPSAGLFSTALKTAQFKDHKTVYPTFASEYIVYDALLYLTDLYNKHLDPVKFLYTLVSIHPFGDGNGRLAKLLYIFCTQEHIMFPPQDLYIQAIIDTRTNIPDDLNYNLILTSNDAYRLVNIFWFTDTSLLEKVLDKREITHL